ncbi:P-loop containing nucleoside triphosphate hydrolase protein, partial [Clohesyomyces aquaticus]
IFENYVRIITVEGVSVEMITWDNSGMEGQERLRRMSYEQAHVVLICFDMSNWDSLDNVSTVWSEEANYYLKNVPRILVGCKADLTEDPKTIAELQRQGQRIPTTQEAEELAQKIKAIAYFETSAKDSKGLDELFEYAVKASLVKTLKKGIRRFLSRSEIKFVR